MEGYFFLVDGNRDEQTTHRFHKPYNHTNSNKTPNDRTLTTTHIKHHTTCTKTKKTHSLINNQMIKTPLNINDHHQIHPTTSSQLNNALSNNTIYITIPTNKNNNITSKNTHQKNKTYNNPYNKQHTTLINIQKQ